MAYKHGVVRLSEPIDAAIRVVITNNPAIVTLWITIVNAHLSLPTVHPKFVFLAVLPDDQSNGSPAVLQILVHHYCLFFQLAHAPPQMPDSLRRFLANRHYTFLGSSMESGLERLHRYYHIGGNSMRTTLEQRYTFRPPEVSTSEWTVMELADDQINLCCIDGLFSYLIAMLIYAVTAGIWGFLLVVVAAILIHRSR